MKDTDVRAWRLSDFPVAAGWWERLSPIARRILAVFADAEPGAALTPDELAQRAGLRGGRCAIAGTLAWPTRYARELGLMLPLQWELGVYSMDSDIAGLFRVIAEEAPRGVA